MKIQKQSDRKARTRLLIQMGGLLQKSGLLNAFNIIPGDDLQASENLEKAAALLGFLTECFEKNEFDEDNFNRWRSIGEKRIREGGERKR